MFLRSHILASNQADVKRRVDTQVTGTDGGCAGYQYTLDAGRRTEKRNQTIVYQDGTAKCKEFVKSV
jgi:Fe-S cluster assembly iron-binding protein IscA